MRILFWQQFEKDYKVTMERKKKTLLTFSCEKLEEMLKTWSKVGSNDIIKSFIPSLDSEKGLLK